MLEADAWHVQTAQVANVRTEHHDRFSWTDPNQHWLLRQLDASSATRKRATTGRDLCLWNRFLSRSRSRRSTIFVLDWTEPAGRTRLLIRVGSMGSIFGFSGRFAPIGETGSTGRHRWRNSRRSITADTFQMALEFISFMSAGKVRLRSP
jgi:hypothetical protein